MILPLIVLLILLAPAAAFADAPNGDATFSMPAASFPLVDLDGPLAGGLPLDLAFTDGKLGDVDVEFLGTLTQGEDGKITGTATLDEAAGSPIVLDLTCEVRGKVRGQGALDETHHQGSLRGRHRHRTRLRPARW